MLRIVWNEQQKYILSGKLSSYYLFILNISHSIYTGFWGWSLLFHHLSRSALYSSIYIFFFLGGLCWGVLYINDKRLNTVRHNGPRSNVRVQITECAFILLYHTSVIRLRLLFFWCVFKNRMHFLSALCTPSQLGVQNMLQELLTLARGQVVEEILRCRLDEPAQTINIKFTAMSRFFCSVAAEIPHD